MAFPRIMKGNIDAARPLGIEEVSRIHFQGGSFLGTSRANPTKQPAHLEQTVKSLARLRRLAAHHHRRRRHRLCRHEGGRYSGRAHPRGPRSQDHRQRSCPSGPRGHVRLPDGAPRRRRAGEEPHGRCADHRPVVSRRGHGAQSRASRAGHRKGRRRHARRDPRGIPGRQDDAGHDCGHPGRCGAQARFRGAQGRRCHPCRGPCRKHTGGGAPSPGEGRARRA